MAWSWRVLLRCLWRLVAKGYPIAFSWYKPVFVRASVPYPTCFSTNAAYSSPPNLIPCFPPPKALWSCFVRPYGSCKKGWLSSGGPGWARIEACLLMPKDTHAVGRAVLLTAVNWHDHEGCCLGAPGDLLPKDIRLLFRGINLYLLGFQYHTLLMPHNRLHLHAFLHLI